MVKGKTFEKIRQRYPNAYRAWSEDDDKRLAEWHRAGTSVQELAKEFGRTRGGIWARLERLGLATIAGPPSGW